MTAQAGDTSYTQKAALRREVRARRLALKPAQRRLAAAKASAHALRLLRRLGARSIALYLPVGSELDTAPLRQQLLRRGLRVCVPRVRHDGRLDFLHLRPGTALRRNAHRIPEPVGARRIGAGQLHAVILPLLAFDDSGQRLGSGGGYYDRSLAERRRWPRRIGYAYSCQRVAALPVEPWDIPLHAIVTERGLVVPGHERT